MRFSKVMENSFFIIINDLRSNWYFDDKVFTIGTSAVAASAMIAFWGFEMLLIAKVNEGVEIVDSFEDDMTASAAIATVWTAIFNEFFTTKAHAAGTAVSAS